MDSLKRRDVLAELVVIFAFHLLCVLLISLLSFNLTAFILSCVCVGIMVIVFVFRKEILVKFTLGRIFFALALGCMIWTVALPGNMEHGWPYYTITSVTTALLLPFVLPRQCFPMNAYEKLENYGSY